MSPLKRDRRLGRAIFDGLGGYEEDLEYGVRVIDLLGMLAQTDLSATDLRRTELSEGNLVQTNLQHCDLGRANLSRCILYGANFSQDRSNPDSVLFWDRAEVASPRDRIQSSQTTELGCRQVLWLKNADFSRATGLSEEQRYYCCAWGGEQNQSHDPGWM